jgi:hypothetical protein
MKISFNIGLVEVESCIILKTIFVTTFYAHCNVLSPLHRIILVSCNIWKMIMAKVLLLNFFYVWTFLIPNAKWFCSFSLFTFELCLLIQLLNFVCKLFKLLFANCAMMFAFLKDRKQCSLVGFLFQESADVIVYLIAWKSQLS